MKKENQINNKVSKKLIASKPILLNNTIGKDVKPQKGELLLMQTQYQQISCVKDEVEKLSNVKTKVDNIEKEVNLQMTTVKNRVKKELMEQVKDMELIKKEVKQLQIIKDGLQSELGQLSAIRKELSSLKKFQEDVKKIKENAIKTSKNLDQVGNSANLFKNSVKNILVKMKVSEDKNNKDDKLLKRNVTDDKLAQIYNHMKKQEEKEVKNNSFIKLGAFILLCINSLVLVTVFKNKKKLIFKKN